MSNGLEKSFKLIACAAIVMMFFCVSGCDEDSVSTSAEKSTLSGEQANISSTLEESSSSWMEELSSSSLDEQMSSSSLDEQILMDQCDTLIFMEYWQRTVFISDSVVIDVDVKVVDGDGVKVAILNQSEYMSFILHLKVLPTKDLSYHGDDILEPNRTSTSFNYSKTLRSDEGSQRYVIIYSPNSSRQYLQTVCSTIKIH